MIKIRLARHGRKNNPFYKIVAIDKFRKREGQPLDIIGFWYPQKDTKKIDKKKLNHWISKGAKVSSGVLKLL